MRVASLNSSRCQTCIWCSTCRCVHADHTSLVREWDLCILYTSPCHRHWYSLVLITNWRTGDKMYRGWTGEGQKCVKVKVKVHTLDIAPLCSESPLQKRSGMACVLKGFHSFTCTPTRSSAIGMSHICLCLPSLSWYSFTDRGGMEGWVDLGAK